MQPKEPTFLDCLHDVVTTGPLLEKFAEANRPPFVKSGRAVAYLVGLVAQDEITTGDLARGVYAHHHGHY